MDDVRAATQQNTSCSDNKLNIKVSSFKSRENIQKKSMGQTEQFRILLKFSSMTLDELTKDTVISSFNRAANTKTDIHFEIIFFKIG